MTMRPFLVLSLASLRLFGCDGEPSGTTVSGSIELSRTSGGEVGQTGFTFPEDTLLDGGPFVGSCQVEDVGGVQILSLSIDHTAPDAFGLASFSLEAALDGAPAAGGVKVTAEAGGTTFEDAAGTCTLTFGDTEEGHHGHHDGDEKRHRDRFDLVLSCSSLAGAPAGETVALSANLSLDECEPAEREER